MGVNTTDVSIVIVNYNTYNLTQACIESIYKRTKGVDFEVIVVENDSKDDSVIKFRNDSRISLIESNKNLGFGRANNLGVKKAKGRYVFFLNSDTILLNNAVKLMADFMDEHGKRLGIGGLGCLLTGSDGKRTHSYAPFPRMGRVLKDEWGDHFLKRFGRRMKRLEEGISIDESMTYFPVNYVTGADLFVARETINRYGSFDPDFFMYYEEAEMQYRWYKNGLKSYILCSPQIVHLEGGSQRKASVQKQLTQLKSMFIYFKKTNSRWKYTFFRLAFGIGRFLTFPFQKMKINERCEYLKLIIS